MNGCQQKQWARIRQSGASGELTRGAADRVRCREAGLRAEKRAMKVAGTVTPQERQDLRRTHNCDSQAIYRQQPNGWVRQESPLSIQLTAALTGM